MSQYNSYLCLNTNIQALYADIGPGTTNTIEGSNVMNMPIYSDPWQVSFLCTKQHVYYLSTYCPSGIMYVIARNCWTRS